MKVHIANFLPICLLLLGCSAYNKIHEKAEPVPSAYVPSEFRAAWVATVANINWPSSPDLSTQEQKEEALRLLDLLADHNYNAVILQIRPQCDAFYETDLEPWSFYLTGSQGKAPEPFYDPLSFWILEAHRRGLELHVWLNPYRAHHTSGGPISNHSIVKTRPELAIELENGYWWLDPANSETQNHSYDVVIDIVKRYDIDGVHFDDYFYPYPSYNNNKDFPDDISYAAYQHAGGKLSRGDWRRAHVNHFVRKVYRGIKKEKKYVKFGISPFGIWRPGHPPTINGFDQYDQLFADAKLWLNKGWIDYFAPQLYWPINQMPQSFPILLKWWKEQNLKDRHLWPGLSIGRMKGSQAIDETINQIMITRAFFGRQAGNIHWSVGPLVTHDSLAKQILAHPYHEKALVPASRWLSKISPSIASVQPFKMDERTYLRIESNQSFMQVIIYFDKNNQHTYNILPYFDQRVDITEPLAQMDTNRLSISILNRYGILSQPTTISVPR